MLKKIRISLAIISIVLLTLLFLDFTGTIQGWFSWLAKIQFVPALMALNVAVIIGLIVVTFVFGRVYCSVICPLGIMQDIFAWFGKKAKKYRYTYSSAKTILRIIVFAIFVAAIIFGISAAIAILDPYAAYGRIAQSLIAPVYIWINNLLASVAEHYESYAFYSVDIWIKGTFTLAVAAVTLIILAILAWRNGRTYCNTFCPVGTFLGFLSKYAIFAPVIDKDKCTKCGLCTRNCKSSCIDFKNSKIDYSRCVDCMDCIGTCRHGAISYTFARKNASHTPTVEKETGVTNDSKVSETRRAFVVTALASASAAAFSQAEKADKIFDGGLADIKDKVSPKRKTKIVPAGAKSLKNLHERCTACQLCVSACPNGVLRPSSDLETFMQPYSSYERGYCRPECTRCSEVCPAGAITKIDREEKSSIQIGHAVWRRGKCIVITDDVECGNCARHCPTGAIIMVNSEPGNDQSRKIPSVNAELCIGCGACENLCPSRPLSAIYVEGHEVHRVI